MNNKTLVLTENFPPIAGGSGRWFWELYSRLDNEQYVILSNQVREASQFDSGQSLRIYRSALASPEWGFRSFTGLKFYWNCFKEVRNIVKREKIKEIHCGRVIHEGVTAWLLHLLTGVPYVCYVHGEDVETAAMSREHDIMVRQVCKKAKLIVCNSQNSAQIVQRLGYASSDKVIVLNPGVDANKFVPAEHDTQFKEKMGWSNKKVVMTVGRLQQRKGQDKMIEAMSLIRESSPEAIYAIIGDGEDYERLHNLVKEHKLEAHVQFYRDLSDQEMIQCYQQCDLFILPNRTIENDIEGFGMVLVEAQACAKPVIAGDSGGTKETMQLNKSGYIIDCTDAQNIADKVSALLADSDLCNEMGNVGRKHVLENLDWNALSKKAHTIFNQ